MSGPRCLPSTASPRFRGKGRSRVRSREVFRIDPARRLFAHDRSRFHVLGQELGAHPRTPPNRLKWRTLASLRQNTSCRLLQRHSTTREHNLERPILARIGGRVSPPAPLRHPCFPCEPFEHARHAIAPASSSGGGQRATPHQTALFPKTVQACPERKHRRPSLFPEPRAKGPRETHRRLRREWSRRWRCAYVDRRTTSEGPETAPSSWFVEHPVVAGAAKTRKDGDTFPKPHPPRFPSRCTPRRGAPSRQSGCFPSFREPGA